MKGHGAGELSTGTDNLVYQASLRCLKELGSEVMPFSIACDNEIPLARGLGSSAAAIVGGLLGASVLAGEREPDMERLLGLAVAIEGHPDNVAAALFGGCQIVVQEGEEMVHAAVDIADELRAVLFIPDAPISTEEARLVLSDKVSRHDAVYNVGRVALLVNALATGSTDSLPVATQDRLHQPAREKLLPWMPLLFRSALDAGALGAFLSGAGSTILALTNGRELTVAYELADTANRAAIPGEVKVTRVSALGAHISEDR